MSATIKRLLSVDQVEGSPVNYLEIGHDDLDWQLSGGLSLGKISVWAGSRGIGKSRTLVYVSKLINREGLGDSVLYITGELPPAQFKTEKLSGYQSNNYYLFHSKSLSEIEEAIYASDASVVIIDSVNMIKAYKKGRGAELLVDGGTYNKKEHEGLRKIAEKTNCHIILVAQLTVSGTTKGGTDLPHLVDTEVYIKPWTSGKDVIQSLFVIEVAKNRYGKSGLSSSWRHTNDGVECESSDRTRLLEYKRRSVPNKKRKGFLSWLRS